MAQEFTPQKRKELLDDFYAEFDELLTGARHSLSRMEASAKQGIGSPEELQNVFRRMHSMKGISSIAGLPSAESLAHAIEDFLRFLTQKDRALEVAEMDILFAGTQRLESLVTAHRLEKPAPRSDDISTELARLTPKRERTGGSRDPGIAQAVRKGDSADMSASPGRVWKATFTPSKELDVRGVSIETVRERISALGTLVSAAPIIGANRQIRFEFRVRIVASMDAAPSWASDGVVFEPVADPIPRPTRTLSEADEPTFHQLAPSHLVRVDLARLDELMRITGELVNHRFRLENRLQGLGEGGEFKEISVALGRSLRELRQAVSKVRLVPISEIFDRMPFVVRDLARTSRKRARVELDGQQTEIDKYIVERLKEPLLHLIRNAFSHGIEEPESRLTSGKPPEATIRIAAENVGELVVIRIRDDGRGVDPKRVVEQARNLGMSVSDDPDPAALLGILCTPGFSTRDEADLTSGRGVGMAVVATSIRELGGTVELLTSPGNGTEFILRIPLTLSIVDAVIVGVGEELCAVPQSSVNEIVQISVSDIRAIRQTEVIPYRDGLLPVVRLRSTFRLPAVKTPAITVLVLNSEHGAKGLVVDRVRTQREIVVRPLLDPLVRTPGIVGATELGNGHPILVLDAVTLAGGAFRPAEKLNATPAGTTGP